MYAIYLDSIEETNNVFHALQVQGAFSRFTFEAERLQGKKVHRVAVRNVRLRQSKPYCGNHAGPCKINPLFDSPHRKMKCLEGADWVAFNDMVNDVLDSMGVNAVRVASSVCIIRRGLERCIEYLEGKNGDFLKEGVYANCIGQSVKAAYPNGTPGIDEWRNNA